MNTAGFEFADYDPSHNDDNELLTIDNFVSSVCHRGFRFTKLLQSYSCVSFTRVRIDYSTVHTDPKSKSKPKQLCAFVHVLSV
jgi:hypothetical protein